MDYSVLIAWKDVKDISERLVDSNEKQKIEEAPPPSSASCLFPRNGKQYQFNTFSFVHAYFFK